MDTSELNNESQSISPWSSPRTYMGPIQSLREVISQSISLVGAYFLYLYSISLLLIYLCISIVEFVFYSNFVLYLWFICRDFN